MNKKIQKILESLDFLDDIKLSEISSVNLYVEQVTSFLEDKLGHVKRNDDDKIITKTMINNYAKSGLIMSPVDNNRKYSKQHVILLNLIYHLKKFISIDDIHTLLKPILHNIEIKEDDVIQLEDIYAIFLDIKEAEFSNFDDIIEKNMKLIESKIPETDDKHEEILEMFLTVLILGAQANARKRLAEKIIDTYFKKIDH